MTEHGSAPAELQPSSCRPWRFWTTTAFALASVVAWLFFQWLAVVAAFAWMGVGPKPSPAQVSAIASHGVMLAAATLLSAPAAIAVIAFAVRRARCTYSDYLALRWPSRLELLFGIGILIVLLPLSDLTSYLTGREIVPAYIVEAYRTARSSGHVVLLLLAIVVAAPLMEELLFRGFLFRGYSETPLRPAGAIVVTSALWAAMHIQYEFFYIVQIFLLGCIFGWLRWRSHSTLLTTMLHAIVNLVVMLQVAILVEFVS